MPLELPAEIASSLEPEVLNDPTIQNYSDLNSVFKGHIETVKYRGNSIALPPKEGKPEEFDKWAAEQSEKFKDRGYTIAKQDMLREAVPADPSGYTFKLQGIDEKVVAEDKILNDFKSFAHAEKISPATAQKAVEWFAKNVAPTILGDPVEVIDGAKVTALLSEKFPGQIESTIENYKRAVDHLKPTNPELPDFLDSGKAYIDGKEISLGDHPVMIKLLSQVAGMFNQDFGGNINGAGVLTRDQQALAAEAEDIMKNKSNPKYELFRTGDPSTHEYVQGLFKRAYPGNVTI